MKITGTINEVGRYYTSSVINILVKDAKGDDRITEFYCTDEQAKEFAKHLYEEVTITIEVLGGE
jgi:hypothetical protein